MTVDFDDQETQGKFLYWQRPGNSVFLYIKQEIIHAWMISLSPCVFSSLCPDEGVNMEDEEEIDKTTHLGRQVGVLEGSNSQSKT